MSILTEIIDSTETSVAINNQNKSRENRGLARNIQGSSLDDMLSSAGLDWKVCEMPVAVVGRTETRIQDAYKALVRSDTAETLGISSQMYTPHQNRDLMEVFAQVADITGGKLKTATVADGGRFISASISLGEDKKVASSRYQQLDYRARMAAREADGFKVGDIVSCRMVITTGHTPGTATKIKGQALRLACLNGATVATNRGSISVRHNRKFDEGDKQAVREMAATVMEGFEGYLQAAEKLAAVRADRDVLKAYWMEVVQPEAFKELYDAAKNSVVRDHRSVGAVVLENILSQPYKYLDAQMGRTAKKIVDADREQDGREYGFGTMWEGYNAVTYFVDHMRGREDGAAVISALCGDGDKLKSRALDLAIEYTERLAL